MKKAQTEIIGFIIIILLILFALLFYSKLSLQPQKKYSQEFEQLFSSNLISSVLKYTPANCEKSIEDLIIYFNTNTGKICSYNNISDLINEIKDIIGDILQDNNFNNYYLYIKYLNGISETDKNCKQKPGTTSPLYIISNFKLKLKLCKD